MQKSDDVSGPVNTGMEMFQSQMRMPPLPDDVNIYPSGNSAIGRVMLLQAILHASGLDEIREVKRMVNGQWK